MSNFLPFIVSAIGVGSVYALGAVGIIVLYKASGVLNFSFGGIAAVAAFVAWTLMKQGLPAVVAIFIAVAAAAAISTAYGAVVSRSFASKSALVPAMSTLGFALVLLGFLGLVFGEAPRRLALPTDGYYIEFFGGRLNYTRLLAAGLTVGAVIFMYILIGRTRLGLFMRALANQRQLSSVLGVRVSRVDIAAWLISGTLAGISGVFLGNLVRLQAYHLTFLVIPAIAAALVGRMTSLWLAALGGLLIGIFEAVLAGFPALAPYRSAVPFLFGLAALALITPSQFDQESAA